MNYPFMEHRIGHIVRLLNLEPYYAFVMATNRSHHLPYHGTQHIICVAEDVYNIYVASYELNRTSLRAAVTAALFHDYNHSGGMLSDKENIENALRGFQQARYITTDTFSIAEIDLIRQAIETTEYDERFVKTPETRIDMALRDADVFRAVYRSTDIGKTLFQGLFNEINDSRFAKCMHTITEKEYNEGQANFQANLTWYTPFCKHLANTALPSGKTNEQATS